ncbi:hypothetical protein [Candidatus Accumulibacter aalborgensis]|nr:hypothetical protein [Candidatus Accumulibacter aalborgensis]
MFDRRGAKEGGSGMVFVVLIQEMVTTKQMPCQNVAPIFVLISSA